MIPIRFERRLTARDVADDQQDNVGDLAGAEEVRSGPDSGNHRHRRQRLA